MAIVSAEGDNLTDETVLADVAQDTSVVYVDLNAGGNGNGSENSPFSSISEAISDANNNSRIVLKDGVYKGVSNTGLNIDKNLIIESASNGVTIDGENKYIFFSVKHSSNLVLNNIKFVNGYTNDYAQLSAINNRGNLTIVNSSFSKMNTVMGAIFNEGTLTIKDSKMSDSVSKNMAQLITNIGGCYIFGSQILNNPYATSGVENGVYNFNVLRIINSRVTLINSNNQYDENLFSTADIMISNSTVSDLDIDNAKVKLVAGDVNIVREQTRKLYAKNMVMASAEGAAVDESFEERSLFEYHMYDLSRKTTIKNNEKKQIQLITAQKVPAKKKYVYNSYNAIDKVYAFLTFKKELNNYGYEFKKLSLKEKWVMIVKKT